MKYLLAIHLGGVSRRYISADLGDDLLIAQLCDPRIARSADVIKEQIVRARRAAGEQRRRPYRAERAHALGARVERAEAAQLGRFERLLRVRNGYGCDGRIVNLAQTRRLRGNEA